MDNLLPGELDRIWQWELVDAVIITSGGRSSVSVRDIAVIGGTEDPTTGVDITRWIKGRASSLGWGQKMKDWLVRCCLMPKVK